MPRYWATNYTGKIFMCNDLLTIWKATSRWAYRDNDTDTQHSYSWLYRIAEIEDTNITENYLRTHSGIVCILDDKTGQVTSVL